MTGQIIRGPWRIAHQPAVSERSVYVADGVLEAFREWPQCDTWQPLGAVTQRVLDRIRVGGCER